MNPNIDRCDKCMFWTLDPRTKQNEEMWGVCRRFPPFAQGPGFQTTQTTKSDSWCGEFQAPAPIHSTP